MEKALGVLEVLLRWSEAELGVAVLDDDCESLLPQRRRRRKSEVAIEGG